LLTQVRVRDLCDGCPCTNLKLGELCQAEFVRNPDDSLLDTITDISTRDTGKAQQLFLNITDPFIRHDLYGVALIVGGHNVVPGYYNDKDLVSRKKMSFGYYENESNGNVTFWGPTLVELEMWEI